MKEIKVTNLISNGDVETSADGWTAVAGTLTHVSFTDDTKALKLTATEDNQNIGFQTSGNITLVRSHKYYLRYHFAQYSEEAHPVQVYWPSTAPIAADSRDPPTTGNWYIATKILDVSEETSGNYPIRFVVQNASNGLYIYYDQILLVDLTTDFGAGNEPNLTWCDANIPTYFDGTVVLPFWQGMVPEFEDAYVTPIEVSTGVEITITAKVKKVGKLFTIESFYSGEINSGEV